MGANSVCWEHSRLRLVHDCHNIAMIGSSSGGRASARVGEAIYKTLQHAHRQY